MISYLPLNRFGFASIDCIYSEAKDWKKFPTGHGEILKVGLRLCYTKANWYGGECVRTEKMWKITTIFVVKAVVFRCFRGYIDGKLTSTREFQKTINWTSDWLIAAQWWTLYTMRFIVFTLPPHRRQTYSHKTNLSFSRKITENFTCYYWILYDFNFSGIHLVIARRLFQIFWSSNSFFDRIWRE